MAATVVCALYQFTRLNKLDMLCQQLEALAQDNDLKGTLLLASEGINGTVAGSREAIDALLAFLGADGRFSDLQHKESLADEPPFLRLKIRRKREIVSMGQPQVNPALCVGRYVDARSWNALLDDPDTLVVDTRNDYEIAIGRFPGAVSPQTTHFREFPEYVARELEPAAPKRIAMYCTGGIRCEKATSYLRGLGHDEVYHLRGGILQYLQDIPAEDNRWQGECFVFDERVAVDRNLRAGSHSLCRACRRPVSAADRARPEYEAGVSCPHCHAGQSPRNRARARERIRQVRLAEQRGEQHLGPRGTT